ncbi:MAG: hypothetical protein HY525_07790 [Betaproteobacteria bacterium]|nr:hypothetical protein [Betaproteobacteria bacterium]
MPRVRTGTLQGTLRVAKARPGELNYAAGPAGSPPHLAAKMFKAMTAVDIVQVPYRGSALALNAVIGGQVQLICNCGFGGTARKRGRCERAIFQFRRRACGQHARGICSGDKVRDGHARQGDQRRRDPSGLIERREAGQPAAVLAWTR